MEAMEHLPKDIPNADATVSSIAITLTSCLMIVSAAVDMFGLLVSDDRRGPGGAPAFHIKARRGTPVRFAPGS